MLAIAPARYFTFLLLTVSLLLSPAVVRCGTIEVTRDPEKTTYSIGPSGSNREGPVEDKDKEKSLDMLNKMNIIIDRDKGTDKKDREK